MMLKFNNALDQHRGSVIYINRNHITAVFEEATVSGGSLSTKIYCANAPITWTVEESLSEVIKKITLGGKLYFQKEQEKKD